MPIYEYKCRDCKKEFEVMQRITADPLTKCEACSGKLDKLISQSAFVLKGTGWYQTDFADKKSSSKNDSAKPNEAKPSEAKPSETKPSETKPSEAKPSEAKSADRGSCPATASNRKE